MSLLNLPEEVHGEIFVRVPAESILLSRCVCKRFYNLLSKPTFIKNHLDRTTTDCKTNNPKLFFFRLSEDNQLMVCSMPVDYASISSPQVSLLNYPTDQPFQYDKFDLIEILGSSNGLVCSIISSTESDRAAHHLRGNSVETKKYFSVLNPLTREFKEFQKTQYCGNRNPGSRAIYGFGYDRNIDDYKLVMISDYECAGCLKIDVYQVKSDSWNSIQGTVVDYLFSSTDRCQGLFFNGAIHWLGASTTQETSLEVIISFDVSNEAIVDMPLPEHLIPPINYQGKMFADVGVWGDCIGVALSWPCVRIEIWVMQEYGVKESWSKRFTITHKTWASYPFWKPLRCYDNGEFLIEFYRELLVLYNPTTGSVDARYANDVCRETYVESIVSLGSGTYLEKRVTDGILEDL